MSDIRKTIKLLPKQYEFINSTEKEVLACSGFGGGKSKVLCYALVKAASTPNNVVLLVRKTLTSLKKTTLLSLIGGIDPVLPDNSYKHNKAEGTITLNGAGVIIYTGLDDVMKIRSMNLGGIYLDEGSELTEEEYMELYYRLRLEHGSRQIFTATNPATPSHWMYKRFFQTKNRKRKVITMSSLENHYLPLDYIQSLKDMEEQDITLYKRNVLGLWTSLENQVYDNFNRDIHVKRIKPQQFDQVYISCDFGYRDPFVILVLGRIGDRLFIIEEIYKKKMLMDDIKDAILDLNSRYDNPIVIYDPSSAILGGEIQNLGLKAIKANNEIRLGISRVRSRLSVRLDSPDLIISDTCLNTVTEFENYIYEKDTEKPLDLNNHCMDCVRYIVNYIDDQRIDPTNQAPQIYSDDVDEDVDLFNTPA